ncbi:MAG TPA: DUF4386 family protein, partial [Thermoanaerobaculia bacterium]|nr:DUF4386 family protein [Thermoanaerobaculia bacterium]
RLLGVLLIVGGVAYSAHSLVTSLLPGPRNAIYEMATMVGRGIGELPTILWLLIAGVDPARAPREGVVPRAAATA